MGEGGTIGAPAAIANALADALAPLGADVVELPMTPERLFGLLQKKRPGHSCGGYKQRSRAASAASSRSGECSRALRSAKT
jgi:hypothetical protein